VAAGDGLAIPTMILVVFRLALLVVASHTPCGLWPWQIRADPSGLLADLLVGAGRVGAPGRGKSDRTAFGLRLA